jgi:DNA polymerase-4
MERMEFVIDDIRRRFGHFSVNRAFMRVDPKLGRLNAKEENIIHPISYM